MVEQFPSGTGNCKTLGNQPGHFWIALAKHIRMKFKVKWNTQGEHERLIWSLRPDSFSTYCEELQGGRDLFTKNDDFSKVFLAVKKYKRSNNGFVQGKGVYGPQKLVHNCSGPLIHL